MRMNEPCFWPVVRLGSLLKATATRGRPDLPLLSVVREKGVIVRDTSSKASNHNFIPDDLSNYKVVEPSHLAINKMKAWSGSLGISEHLGIVSPAYYVFETSFAVPRFAHYLLRSRALADEFARCSDGVRVGQWDLSIAAMKNIGIALPPPEEQKLIVRYLDNAELRIARAIQAKQRMADLLRESRQSKILSELLPASGSNPIFEGAHYLAPEGWRNVPLWTVAREIKQTNRPDLQLLSVFLDRGVIRYGEGGGQVHKPSLDLSGYQEVRPGDLVLNNQQAWRGSLGVSSHNGIVSPAYVVCSLVPEIDAEWANSYFRSPIMVDQFALASRGVGSIQRQLHGQSLRKVRVSLPPMDEQQKIARRIRGAVSSTDAALESNEREIELLREYRLRLISDVVTGKKDVRAEASGMKDVDPVELAEVLAGVTSAGNDELGEEYDAE